MLKFDHCYRIEHWANKKKSGYRHPVFVVQNLPFKAIFGTVLDQILILFIF